MPLIEYIRNVTVAKHFENQAGTISVPLTGMPDQNPDEMIVRAINFNGEAIDNNLYLIWCNVKNDYIGSFCGGSIAPHFPQTHLWLTSPVPNTLEIVLYGTDVGGNRPIQFLNGDLAIHLDFIKYKRTPTHA